jgi:hypothetical protein
MTGLVLSKTILSCPCFVLCLARAILQQPASVFWQLPGKMLPHAAIIIFYYPANYGDSIVLPASNPCAELSVFLPYWLCRTMLSE